MSRAHIITRGSGEAYSHLRVPRPSITLALLAPFLAGERINDEPVVVDFARSSDGTTQEDMLQFTPPVDRALATKIGNFLTQNPVSEGGAEQVMLSEFSPGATIIEMAYGAPNETELIAAAGASSASGFAEIIDYSTADGGVASFFEPERVTW